MKRLFFLVLPGLVFAQTYSEIIGGIENATALKSAQRLEMAAKKAAEAAEGKRLPSLEASFDAAWLKDTPTVTFRIPGTPPLEAPMGTKRNFAGSLRLAYPLFTGFAVTAAIDEAKWERKRAELEALDLKRNLYLQATELAAACYAADETLKANLAAKKAMDDAYDKAKGLYDNGLLPPSDLYNIEARRYAVEAEITEAKSRKRQILNRLAYLLNEPVDSVELPLHLSTEPVDEENLTQTALQSREDIRALQSLLMIDRSRIRLAKSRLYPTVGLAAELKRRGDTPELNGDGFTNPDQSYIGASIRWNLFNGFSDSRTIEAARYRHLASAERLKDYKERVRTELENAFLRLSALNSRLQSATMELKAQEAYCRLTRGRFDNQLAGADELSRSIADLSAARAKVSVLESRIFNQKAALWLMAGIDSFKKRFLAPTAP
ncbi:TolC family protein [Hydrogenimonas sp.]